VVEAESDFRPKLISNKNAQGLMQIIPSTGRLMGADDLFNPSENIAAGTKYLRYLFDRFGDQRIALAAYNAGEGNVEKFGGVPPFAETQNYLVRVSAHHREYRQQIRGRYIAALRMRNSVSAPH
jgi:soluble lytic murein transglycosylase-like protein